MSLPKFKLGQDVYYSPPRGALMGPLRYKIVRILPADAGEFAYRIKATSELFERVAKERELKKTA